MSRTCALLGRVILGLVTLGMVPLGMAAILSTLSTLLSEEASLLSNVINARSSLDALLSFANDAMVSDAMVSGQAQLQSLLGETSLWNIALLGSISTSISGALSGTFSGVKSIFHSLGEWLFSLEGAVSVLGKICMVAAVGFASQAGENFSYADLRRGANTAVNTLPDSQAPARATALSSYASISSRNIFAAVSKKAPAPKTAEPVSNLKLRLVGTSVSSKSTSFAIIENTSKKEQDVFDLNESVFGQAKLVEVLKESVKLNRNGKIEILVLQEAEKKSSSSGDEGGIESLNDDQTEFSVAEAELEDALANLPRLLSQARAVPYFRNGKSVGMRLFAIRRGSLYEKLGLKNGDIIKEVNDNSLTDPAQALKLFEQLKSERSIEVKVERSGQDTPLRYAIE